MIAAISSNGTANMSCRTKASRSAGVSVSSTMSKCNADRVGEQRLVLGIAAISGVDDRVRHIHLERLFTPRSARAEHVQRHACDNRRQPAAKVLDLARIGAAEAQPGVLDGVVSLAERAEHPVGDRPKMWSLILELAGEPFLLIHVTFLPRSVSQEVDPRNPWDVTEEKKEEDTMRVFVTGASGALGSRLVPQLIDAGHDVIGTHHSPASAELLRRLGAKPLLVDLLDVRAVRKAVLDNEPEAIVHEATALGNAKFGRNFDKAFAMTNQLRTKGTDALLAAAREAGVRRFVAQSFASYRYIRAGGPIKTEDDPLDPTSPPHTQQGWAAMAHLDEVVTDFGGIALRYGGFYGAANDGWAELVRKRMLPIIGDGGGFISWIHLEDAAAATVLALEHEGPEIYNIVDDEPAPVRECLPVLAQSLGAKPPRHFPVWLARLVAGEAAVVMATEVRGASNAKAKRELGWTLRYPSWRTGFPAVYSPLTVAA